jgi:hypothetical protein
MKLAMVVTVSVHVHLAGTSGIVGLSTSSTLVGDDYSEVRLAENAVKRFRAAKAGMLVRLAEKRAIESRQQSLFAELQAGSA